MSRTIRFSVPCMMLLVLAAFMPAQEVQNPQPPRKGLLRIVCLGDSITQGYGLKDPALTYPKQLGKILGAKALVNAYGAGGTTYFNQGVHPFQITAWKGYVELWNPEVVVLAFGTNCSHPNNWKHKEQYAKDIDSLIDKVHKAGGPARIYICLPPPAFSDKWNLSDKTMSDDIIPILKKFAEERKYNLIDLRTPLLDKAKSFPDTIHPNEDGMG